MSESAQRVVVGTADTTATNTNADDREYNFQLVTSENRILRIPFKRNETIGILKERIEKNLAENNFRVIPKEKQKLIFNDQVLKPDNSPVYWIAGVGVSCKIHLVDDTPNQLGYRSSRCSIEELEREEGLERKKRILERDNAIVRARFRNFQVYQKNFDACVQTAKMNRDSIERMRFNEPDGAIPKIPDCRDLGYILRDMAKTIQEYSFQLARLSDELIHDEKYANSREYHNIMRSTQNLMDAARYLSPQLKLLNFFVIPLETDSSVPNPRRFLGILKTGNQKERPLKKITDESSK